MGHKNHKKKRIKHKNKPKPDIVLDSIVQTLLNGGIVTFGVGDDEVTLTYDICTDDEEEPTE